MKKYISVSLVFALFFITGCSNSFVPAKNQATDNNNASVVNENSQLGVDFKRAMDEYEDFFDQYIDIVKKYNSSNGTDAQIIQDYTNCMKKYVDVVDSFDKWKDDDLNSAELKYYLEVQSRVSQKLVDASIN